MRSSSLPTLVDRLHVEVARLRRESSALEAALNGASDERSLGASALAALAPMAAMLVVLVAFLHVI